MTAEKTENKITSFKDLRVWQEGMALTEMVYQLCAQLPKEEIYGLASQMKRAVVSIPSNIAEGHSRKHRAEYRQFVYIAVGSLAELETQIQIAQNLQFVKSENLELLKNKIDHLRAMLITLGGKLS
ncbi:MAG TPA: four helix bundle protein [Candidatus Omnitrophota bacterium]|nr:four helix bundle protein [Candidatus Omnitrophota bacterium]